MIKHVFLFNYPHELHESCYLQLLGNVTPNTPKSGWPW